MCRPPFPKGAVVKTTMHATHISQCLGQSFGLPNSPRQHNSNALQYPGCVYVAARKPNSQRGWEKASTFLPPKCVYIRAMFDFRFFLQPPIAKPQVMGADFPRVLQRFSIMPPQAKLTTQILHLLACTRIRSLPDAAIGAHLKGNAVVFNAVLTLHVQVCASFFFPFSNSCAAPVCLCVQIQSDVQSTEGVKINVLFSFTFMASNNSSLGLRVTKCRICCHLSLLTITPNFIKQVDRI